MTSRLVTSRLENSCADLATGPIGRLLRKKLNLFGRDDRSIHCLRLETLFLSIEDDN